MSGNNSSTCSIADSLMSTEKSLSFAAYAVVTPIYLVLGILSRGIGLIAFHKQSKKEKAYAYQGYAFMSELLEVIIVSLCMGTRNNLSGYRLPGALWYQQSYPLMWYAACLASPLEQAMITTSVFLYLCMAADRIFAMNNPFVYKNINHRRHQLIAVTVSFALGLSTSIFDIFRYTLSTKNGIYVIVVREEYVATTTAFALAILRNVVRIVGNLALVICNVLMILLYRYKVTKVSVMEGKDNGRQAKRKSVQRTLVLLTLCQSIFTTADLSMFNVYYSLVYSSPSFTGCYGKLMAPIDDLVLQITAILETFVLMTISKQFRQTAFACVKCKCGYETTVVQVL